MTIANPAAGLWVVLVDGFAVPAGTTTYNYVDVFANPAFGIDQRDRRQRATSSGRQLDGSGTVTANAAPAAGRVLLGNVQVRTDANVLVGSGDVVVQSVTVDACRTGARRHEDRDRDVQRPCRSHALHGRGSLQRRHNVIGSTVLRVNTP